MNGKKSVGKKMADKLVTLYGFDKGKILTSDGSMIIPQIEEVVPEEEEEEDDLVLFLRDERKGYDITLTEIYEKTNIPVKVLKEAQQGISDLPEKYRKALTKYANEVREYFQEEAIGNPIGKPTGYYYPEIYAKAGFDLANFNDEMQRVPVYIPNFSKDVIFIKVYGDSMYPKYKAGDVIGIKPIDFIYLVFGHPYVVVFDNGDVNIKYVRKGSDDLHVSLESENPKYDPREYPLRIIRAFYTVEGSVKKERM
ncbi:S24 family peptidase [Capnocytophaga gingivalis]|uniref:S24 family peptidase n=1 Tax=Capnocytophaga gingivalis TaxID=1017 RepID=UPI003C774275